MTEQNEMFPVESVSMDSPKLAWMKKHKLLTYSYPDDGGRLWMAAFDQNNWQYENVADFFQQETAQNGETGIGIGTTEDEAIESLCKLYNQPLWNEETP